jgi:putative hydrolase of the HAD superfamily
MKPERQFFEQIAERIGGQAERPLMFDDSPAVVTAANGFGWEGVLYEELSDCANHPWVKAILN